MKCKDIPDETIMHVLAKSQGRWAMRWHVKEEVEQALGIEIPEKLWLAKMRGVIRRKLSGGCDCSCRGDYEITDKGLALVGIDRTAAYTGI